ncbi:MAG: phosphoheptose isomerase [Candidatus Woesearchaeota archaeon]
MLNNKLKAVVGKDGKKKSPKLARGLKNFIIDIDGVISEDIPNEEPERMKTAFVITGSLEQVNRWYDKGHMITFFTSRTEDLREITEDWIKSRGFKYHNIIFNKPRGGNYHYIDDKRIRATRFDGRLKDFVLKKRWIEVFK